MADTTKLQMPLMSAAQAQKHVTHNEAIQMLDVIVQLSALSRTLTAPPGSPVDGDTYIIGSGATGAWAGRDLNIAARQAGAWRIYIPRVGWQSYVVAEGAMMVWDGSAWVASGGGSSGVSLEDLRTGVVPLLGLNGATADTTNRFSINTPALLLNNAGAGIDMTFNKKAVGNDASLSFKTGFSARALLGLLGSDDLSLKVSATGLAFLEALVAEALTGRVAFPNSPPQVDEFNTAGTFTWTKPAWATRFIVMLVGGGGGGGSGASGNASAVRAGGGGGGAGAVSIQEFLADEYSSTCTILVGAGGTSGAAATTANGANGGNGGASEFRLNGSAASARALIASAGNGGTGGSTTGTGGVGGSVGTHSGTSNPGGNGGTASAAQQGISATLAYGPGGGGGGGGKSTTPAVTNAGAGGIGYAVGSNGRQVTGGAAGGTGLGGNNGGSKSFARGCGSGGGGGGAHLTATGGNGGNGGPGGGGGGGGGASVDAVASGAGGVGGIGMAVIISYVL